MSIQLGRSKLILLVLLLVALSARLWNIGEESIWFDEAYSVHLSRMPVIDLVRECGHDTAPPGYYLGLKLWINIFGNSETAIRSLSSLWSIIGLLFLYLLAGDIGDKSTAALTLLLGGLAPLDVYYAQEARMYIQWAAFGTASTFFLWKWMTEKVDPSRKKWFALGYVISGLGLMASHLAGVAFLAAQGLWALTYWLHKRQWREALLYSASGLLIVSFTVAWVNYILHFREQIYSFRLAWMARPAFNDLWIFFLRDFFWGRATLAGKWQLLAAGISMISLLGTVYLLFVLRKKNKLPLGPFFFLVWMILMPVGIAFTISHLYQPIYYRPRFCVIVLPYFLLLMGWAESHAQSRLIAVVPVMVMLAGVIWQGMTQQKDDFRAFAKDYQAHRPTGAVFEPAYFSLAAEYYLPDLIVLGPTQAADLLNRGKTVCYCQAAKTPIPMPFPNTRTEATFFYYGLRSAYLSVHH